MRSKTNIIRQWKMNDPNPLILCKIIAIIQEILSPSTSKIKVI